MKYLLIILLMATPAFACDPREVVLGKTKTYRILFRGLSKGGNLVEIYRNEKTHAWFAARTDHKGKMCVLMQGRGFETMSLGLPVALLDDYKILTNSHF